MADISNLATTGTLTTSQQEITIDDLAPNNYITIIWKDFKTDKVFNTMDIAQDEAIEYTNAINASIENAINSGNVTYVGQNRFINIESIAKYISQNTIKDATRRRVANALIGLASGDPSKLTDNTINLLINVFGEIATKTARELGYSDPHQIFSQITGQNVINTFKTLGSKAKDFIDDFTGKINKKSKNDISSKSGESKVKRYAGLLLGLTTSDTESYEITIPRKKVEDGSDYTTHLLPKPFKKDLTVRLTNKVISSNYNKIEEINNIEAVKDKLIEIANSHTLFDIYIRLSNEKVYKRANVSFSSLSFAKDEDSGNGYTCTFSLEPVGSFKSKMFISDKKFGISGNTSGNNSSGTKNNRNQDKKSSNGNSFEVGWREDPIKTTSLFKNLDEAKTWARKQEPMYDIVYSKNSNPQYKFTRDTSYIDGYYALTDDTDPKDWVLSGYNGRGGNRKLKKDFYVTKVGKNWYINNGKEQYTIIKVNYGKRVNTLKIQ